MRPLSIGHTEASLGWGGQEIRILTEARGFIDRGHRVAVYAPPASRIAAEAPAYGVPLCALPIGRKRPAGVAALARALRTARHDVVNTHSSTDSWLAAVACRMMRDPPAIVRTRHVSVAVPNDPATRWLYRTATARVVTTGEALRAQLVRDNGLDPARVPKIHAETVAKQNNGVISLVDEFIVPHLDELAGADRERADKAIAALRAAVKEHQAWLDKTLVPNAKGDFRIGAEL